MHAMFVHLPPTTHLQLANWTWFSCWDCSGRKILLTHSACLV